MNKHLDIGIPAMLKTSLELKGTKLRGLGGQSNLLMRVIIASVRPLTLTFVTLTDYGLRTPGEEIDFTALPKIHSHSQIFRYG